MVSEVIPPVPEVLERIMAWGPLEWQILAELFGYMNTTAYFASEEDVIVIFYEEDDAKRVDLLGRILKFSTTVELGEWRFNERVLPVYGAVIEEMAVAMKMGNPWLGAVSEAMERPEAYLRGVIRAAGEIVDRDYEFFTLNEDGMKAISGYLRLLEIPFNMDKQLKDTPESIAEYPPLRVEGVTAETAYIFILKPEDAERLVAALGG